MWSRSAKDKVTGLMTVVCTDWNGNEFFRGEFSDLQEAESAGRNAERVMMDVMNTGGTHEPLMSIDEIMSEMSDDEILSELIG